MAAKDIIRLKKITKPAEFDAPDLAHDAASHTGWHAWRGEFAVGQSVEVIYYPNVQWAGCATGGYGSSFFDADNLQDALRKYLG